MCRNGTRAYLRCHAIFTTPRIVPGVPHAVGAGIAGLNALVVVSEYLSPTGSVVLVDHRECPGGMWNNTYDYARLDHLQYLQGGHGPCGNRGALRLIDRLASLGGCVSIRAVGHQGQ